MEQIIENGVVTRGWVGIGVQDITPELVESLKLPQTSGALITDVVTGGPADKAGIKPGDVLVSVADKSVKDYASTLEAISALKPNTSAVLKILRGAKETSLTVNVGLRPKPRREEQPQ
jgi:S1-C subfamily serine protease